MLVVCFKMCLRNKFKYHIHHPSNKPNFWLFVIDKLELYCISAIFQILLNSTIFGRMTPKQKTSIIEDLQKIR